MLILHALAFICLLIASITDVIRREVPDYLAYFFIFSAILLRLWYSDVYGVKFFVSGLLTLALTFSLSYLLYKNGMWGGGDVFMFSGVAAAFGLDGFFFFNFLLNFFVIGSIYGVLISLIYGRKNVRLNWKIIAGVIAFALPFLFIKWNFALVIGIAAFSLINWRLFKEIEDSMVVEMPTSKLEVGDWLAEDIKVNGKLLKAGGCGLTQDEIALLRKYKRKVKIRFGIPFIPSFFITYLFTLFFGNFFLG